MEQLLKSQISLAKQGHVIDHPGLIGSSQKHKAKSGTWVNDCQGAPLEVGR